MTSPNRSDDRLVDFARDVPTTSEDVVVLRRLRRETPSWFDLTLEEVEALIPADALRRRSPTRSDARPFTLF